MWQQERSNKRKHAFEEGEEGRVVQRPFGGGLRVPALVRCGLIDEDGRSVCDLPMP